jgi:predicted metalloprotease with PDZ domain
MKKCIRLKLLIFICLLHAYPALSQPRQTEMNLTLSVHQARECKFHVRLDCEGFDDEILDFKIPAISPGFYRVLDFAENVENFRAESGDGTHLPWEKTTKNGWRVAADRASSLAVSYDVKAAGRSSVAESFIDSGRAYVSPTSVFMYIPGRISHPVTVAVTLPGNFHGISTGLDPVEGVKNTFFARNFDVLYDCPIYMGNQETIAFHVRGIPHYVAMENPGPFDREEFTGYLKKMTESAVDIMGEIPYKHYTFMFMGRGRGGLEHMNSTAMFTSVSGPQNPALDMDWLSFVAHEYFHLFNVKSIRPIALGPFDYGRENLTHMLWLSEGGTVYYEYIILNRAGFLGRDECLRRFSGIIARYENNPARLTQSVAEASRSAWTQSFFGGEGEISYYDKGLGISVLLDLKIRHETKNNRSLDDVMRTCYHKFHKERNRGFTDLEFRQVCENIAGVSLSGLFDYVYSTREIDYRKYFAYAGLTIELPENKDEECDFSISPAPNPSPMQMKILAGWLKE